MAELHMTEGTFYRVQLRMPGTAIWTNGPEFETRIAAYSWMGNLANSKGRKCETRLVRVEIQPVGGD